MGVLDLPDKIPDPRPAKADPHHRQLRKKIEEKNEGFGWKKSLVLALVGITLLFNVPKDVEKHEKKHKRNGSISRSRSRSRGSEKSYGGRSRSRGYDKRRDRDRDDRRRANHGGRRSRSVYGARDDGYDRRDYQRSGRYDRDYRDDGYYSKPARPGSGRWDSQSSW
jgi:hypothetical protein